MKSIAERLLLFIATVGPVGWLPASGTAGSALAAVTGWYLAKQGFFILAAASLAALLIGIVASELYSRRSGKKDASEIIIDEVAGQWSVLLCIAPDNPHALYWYAAAFGLFRLFDIIKPGPVSWAEKLEGGIGIMADDMVAAGLAGICLLVLQAIFYMQ